MFMKLLLHIRYISIVAVLSSFLGSIMMFYIGAQKTLTAIIAYFYKTPATLVGTHLKPEDIVTIGIIESLDAFLLALVLLFFGYAIYILTFGDIKHKLREKIPGWLIPRDLIHLKETLTHVIIIILFVLFVRLVWQHLRHLDWKLMILPLSITLLAIAVRVMSTKEE